MRVCPFKLCQPSSIWDVTSTRSEETRNPLLLGRRPVSSALAAQSKQRAHRVLEAGGTAVRRLWTPGHH